MAQPNKTQATTTPVAAHLAAIADAARRADCEALAQLMQAVTGHAPQMWGTSIVGFGTLNYAYASGRTGQICLLGFASRKSDIVLYGVDVDQADLLAQMGAHKLGKGCLYIRRLQDVNQGVLTQLLHTSVQAHASGLGVCATETRSSANEAQALWANANQ